MPHPRLRPRPRSRLPPSSHSPSHLFQIFVSLTPRRSGSRGRRPQGFGTANTRSVDRNLHVSAGGSRKASLVAPSPPLQLNWLWRVGHEEADSFFAIAARLRPAAQRVPFPNASRTESSKVRRPLTWHSTRTFPEVVACPTPLRSYGRGRRARTHTLYPSLDHPLPPSCTARRPTRKRLHSHLRTLTCLCTRSKLQVAYTKTTETMPARRASSQATR